MNKGKSRSTIFIYGLIFIGIVVCNDPIDPNKSVLKAETLEPVLNNLENTAIISGKSYTAEIISNWILDIQLVTDDGVHRDINNRIGVCETCEDGIDGFDFSWSTLPVNVTEYGVLYFWDPPRELDYDYRSNNWDAQFWELRVWTKNVTGNWNLRWPNISNVPGNLQLTLYDQNMDITLVADMRTEREYSFNLAGEENVNFLLGALVIEDIQAPILIADFLQNPLLTDRIDLYIFPDEPLGNLTVLVNDLLINPAFNEDGNNNIYRTSFEIEKVGINTIIFTAEDLVGNNDQDTLTIDFQNALVTKRVTAPDGKVEIAHYSENLSDSEQYVGIGFGLDKTHHILSAEMIGNIYTVHLPLLRSGEEPEIRFKLSLFDVDTPEYTDLSVYRETSEGWRPVPATLDPFRELLIARINRGGRYILLKDGGISSIQQFPLPATTRLLPTYPNPYNAVTRIPYSLAIDSHVRIVVYNLLGQEVKILQNEFQEPGNYASIWRGDDKSGSAVASGLYFLRFEAGNDIQIRKISLIK